MPGCQSRPRPPRAVEQSYGFTRRVQLDLARVAQHQVLPSCRGKLLLVLVPLRVPRSYVTAGFRPGLVKPNL